MKRYWRLARTDPTWFAQRVREEAETRAVSARRRVRREADAAVRTAAARAGLDHASRNGPTAIADYFAVLDGRTLNLHVPGPGQNGPVEVVFTRLGQEHRAAAERSADGSVSATVVLGADLDGGVPLTPGRWKVALSYGTAGGDRRLRLLADAPTITDPGGPTVTSPPCAETGARFVPEISPTGLWALRVAAPEPSAEVTRLALTLSRFDVEVRFAGVTPPPQAALRFQARGGAAFTVPATSANGVFGARVPLAEMVREGQAGEVVWNVMAVIPDHAPLRVGRHLHDVRDPRRTLRVPQRTIAVDAATLVRVRTYYTGNGDLALACSPGARSTEVPL
ncbi:hypothetical protein J4573_15320 [Actinomadura barringtoniae]|uniref:Uncharacterized protein n=1 Tax=Actinomadura barringtoniae TaxID=1427535 RepID=A0A939PH73_9ACTN|nr:hypothetical protein [Actinomadura barringtoniae]MBO2448471.1 hypothetical protein [Actinomadura barringtoniae]